MTKCIKHTDLYIGQLIVVTDHPETQVYTIASVERHAVMLVWFEGTRICTQATEKYGLMKPTLKQIEYSIAANGRLASTKDI